jgi:TolA-binding protein
MRKFLISLAVATSALAVASPASAQYYPQPQGYGSGQQGYGYNNNYGQVRSLQVRINQIQRQIARLDQRNILSNREARRLRDESRSLERRLRDASRNGLNFRERQYIEVRIARLEMRVRREATDGNGRGYGYNGQNGQYAYDRDRDGRDDRYEDDQGRDRDD